MSHTESVNETVSSSAREAGEIDAGLRRAAELIRTFYEGLDERAVAPDISIGDTARQFQDTIGDEGAGLERTLGDVERWVLPRAMGIPHPLYLGLINSSPLPGGIVAESIIGALNNNGGAWIQSPPFSAAEEEVVRSLRDVMRLPKESSGFVLPGGSYTALHGLQLARDQRLPPVALRRRTFAQRRSARVRVRRGALFRRPFRDRHRRSRT